MKRPLLLQLALTLAFTVLGLAVMGYHPGVEDDAVYLSAIQYDLNPALYQHDSAFFKIQLQATLFDNSMAWFVEATKISVYWAELFWQFLSLFAILWACRAIAARLFTHPLAEWAAVAMVSAMFTLPVAGTALTIADQYLHPRILATALILLAVDRILAGSRFVPMLLLTAALLFHPIMAVFGLSFCAILSLLLWEPAYEWICYTLRTPRGQLALATPLGWIFEPPSSSWYAALHTRHYFFLTEWTWYEWLGALAPILLFTLLWSFAHRFGQKLLARVALAVTAFAVFQFLVAIIILSTPALVRLTPLQPMRFLHLVYLFLALLAGGLIGEHLLRFHILRWVSFLVVINTAMYAGQRSLFPASPHFEVPGDTWSNPWLQAFGWVRHNTPQNAFFAIDPDYLAANGEDYHSFRALAERSQLADAIKDASVSSQVPELAPYWQKQVEAQSGLQNFKLAEFERLHYDFGINWVLVYYPAPAGLECRWHNRLLAVCAIPQTVPNTGIPRQSSFAPASNFVQNRGKPHRRHHRRHRHLH